MFLKKLIKYIILPALTKFVSFDGAFSRGRITCVSCTWSFLSWFLSAASHAWIDGKLQREQWSRYLPCSLVYSLTTRKQLSSSYEHECTISNNGGLRCTYSSLPQCSISSHIITLLHYNYNLHRHLDHYPVKHRFICL